MLGTLRNKDKNHWRDFVKPVVHAYNCTKHETTGFTPYELMFGRQPRLPIDLAFRVPVNNSRNEFHSQYVKTLKTHLQESYELARKNAAKVAARNKTRYDKRVTESSLDVGDRILVRNVRLRGKHKLADKWDSEVYIVVNRAGELPVYTVKPEGKEGPLRTLHRDLLLPCGFLSPSVEDEKMVLKSQRGRTVQREVNEEEPESSEQCLDYDGEDDDYLEQEIDPCSKPTPVRFVKEFDVVRASRKIPFRNVEPVTQMQPNSNLGSANIIESIHEEYSPEPEYLPETQSSSGPVSVHSDVIPERGRLEERICLSETEQQSLNDPANFRRENETNTNTEQNQKSIPHIPVEGDRVDPVESETPEEDTESDGCEAGSRLRKSKRVRQRSKRLTYPELGNPMISIIQSLLQGLNTAFIETLAEQPRSFKHPKI
ncbi:uncharacterized protein LOC127643136 [Xyrauchen texanus]|uniref:uncharacterized protein LOC127643136 n=1 Tax=Xyrauchen texanus TaxID=154827 RepID=UPI002241DF1F|nr:uncharacterized protein LOC127643136 [Xyrauchen texanus]XP_051981696.1 uncharacterized protein LOC127643136 [Xyrauchen texanus]